MRKLEVRVGATYSAKVSNAVVPVVLLREHEQGGWAGRNETTGREVRIKSAQRLREELAPPPKPERDPDRPTVAEVNVLRTARLHLAAQIEAGVDTPHATLDEAQMAIAEVEGRLAEAEAQLRDVPEAQHLFRSRAGRKPKSSPQSPEESNPQPQQEVDSMAGKSKAAQLEEVQAELRRVEKLAGTTKWALSGAGAKANPPSKERKAHLTEKLAKEQAQIAALRKKRDGLKPKPAAKKAAAA